MKSNNSSMQFVLAPVQLDQKWGFIDLAGRIRVDPNLRLPKDYREENPFSEGVAVVMAYPDLLYGAIDPSGSWIIKPQYPGLSEFEDGLALILYSTPGGDYEIQKSRASKHHLSARPIIGNNSFLDMNGNVIIFDEFDDVSPFREGLAAVKKGDLWGYIDKNGKVIISPQFFEADDFWNGLARVDAGSALDTRGDRINKYGFIDRKGEWVIKPRFEFADSFYSDYCIVEVDDRQGVIDSSGSFAVSCEFYFPANWNQFKENVVFAQDPDSSQDKMDKIGLLDKEGQWIVEPVFDEVKEFSKGLAAIRIDEKWGFIDSTGKWIIHPQFDSVGDFKDDITWAESNGRFGYIDRLGRSILPFEFEDVGKFSFGRAAVRSKGKYGYIDQGGKFIIPPDFEKAGMFHAC